MYLSKKDRQEVITLLLLAAHIEEHKASGKGEKWFGTKGYGWLKQAGTLIIKAFQTGLAPQLDEQESRRMHKDAQKFAFKIVDEETKELSLPLQVVYTMAERAIGNTCRGCTITAYKSCELFQSLDLADIPPACQEQGECPYRQ